MFARGGKFLVVTALVLTTGLHWAALQTVAWTTMLASNLGGGSFSQAVGKTFDGKHPCCLCKAVTAGQKSQKKAEAVAKVLKIEFPPVVGKIALLAPVQFELVETKNFFAKGFAVKPPLPPPRNLPV